VRSISVLASHSKEIRTVGEKKERSAIEAVLISGCLLVVLLIIQSTALPFCHAALIDRVVAYVDDQAITYSEFRERYGKMKQAIPDITEEEAINSMINTLLLLGQARKMRLEAVSDDDLVKEYVDIKIKSGVFIKEETLTEYYNKHREEFQGRDYLTVREEIEKYLTELETNKRLKEHLEELKNQSNIVIRLRDM
jgi:hypothetical protein